MPGWMTIRFPGGWTSIMPFPRALIGWWLTSRCGANEGGSQIGAAMYRLTVDALGREIAEVDADQWRGAP